MPELPEVETLCRQLHEKICGKKILMSKVYDEKLTGVKNLRGRVIRAVERRGKTVTILLDGGEILLIHLRMTGRLFWQKNSTKPRHGRWRMSFGDGHVFLIDHRRFATIKIVNDVKTESTKDVLGEFDLKSFMANNGRRRTNVKTIIMDQKAVEGIGNIYACEILHRTSTHPERMAETLTKAEWKNIFCQAKAILKVAIKKRGTSISDWRDLYGCRGENQHELTAYGREGKNCKVCGGVIRRIKQGGRSTFYCPGCQKY